ncbi:MAG: Sir2 silent information regulator family NAD-dependent deacetylase [Eubacteriales bacterium]|nr:Sir2 silent information regulator family NAD-dependent deacetylase [Eubacteriales bacterium]
MNKEQNILLLQERLEQADAVVIGAGAGLSAAAGFLYSGARYQKHFADFEARYGFHDMYSGGFYPFATPEERWAYWSRLISINRYAPAPKPVYDELLALVAKKDYFVLTTNVDQQFQKVGFDKKRLFYPQGDYGLLQCSEPCCQQTYDNKKVVEQMVKRQADLRIPSELVPLCPVCGKPMTMNLRADEAFVEDEGWHAAVRRYGAFLQQRQSSRTLFLELRVGMNTPVFRSLRTKAETKKMLSKQRASGHLQPLISNNVERRCA